MTNKSRGLPGKLGCDEVIADEGKCLAGDRMVILCRKPPKQWRRSTHTTGSHPMFEAIARQNVIAKLEVGYTSTKK